MNSTTPADDKATEEVSDKIEVVTEAVENTEPEKTEDPGDETVVTIAGESPPQEEEEKQAPEWVRNLRKINRELQREKRELEERLKSVSPAPEQFPVTPGKKPTLEDCDYDSDKFENELAGWFERKRQSEEAEVQQRSKQREEQESWQKKLEGYTRSKTGLKVSDFEDAEETVLEALNVTQQGILLEGAENPAIVVYALGKRPKIAKALSEITSPIKFAFAVAQFESQLTVTSKKQAPPPEKKINGNGSLDSSNAQLERLREEASRTGDMTKVIAYKRQLKNQS